MDESRDGWRTLPEVYFTNWFRTARPSEKARDRSLRVSWPFVKDAIARFFAIAPIFAAVMSLGP